MSGRLTARLMGAWLPSRKTTAHKGDCGRVFILGGSRGMAGAPILAGWGAVQGGAGLVRLGTVRSQQPVVSRRAPLEATTEGFLEGSDGRLAASAVRPLLAALAQFNPTVLAIGPGMGVSGTMRSVVSRVISRAGCGMVVDADALTALAGIKTKLKRSGPLILTPHPGEAGRLLQQSTAEVQQHRIKSAKEIARRWGAVCVLKGAGTLITDGQKIWINPTGNPGLASGGTGDVLTGLIAALWGQMGDRTRASALKAACLGVYLHGLAGDLAWKTEGGLSVRATRLAEWIPSAIRRVRLHRPS